MYTHMPSKYFYYREIVRTLALWLGMPTQHSLPFAISHKPFSFFTQSRNSGFSFLICRISYFCLSDWLQLENEPRNTNTPHMRPTDISKFGNHEKYDSPCFIRMDKKYGRIEENIGLEKSLFIGCRRHYVWKNRWPQWKMLNRKDKCTLGQWQCIRRIGKKCKKNRAAKKKVKRARRKPYSMGEEIIRAGTERNVILVVTIMSHMCLFALCIKLWNEQIRPPLLVLSMHQKCMFCSHFRCIRIGQQS